MEGETMRNFSMFKSVKMLTVAATLGLAMQATSAKAIVIVLGSGMGQVCYEAAKAASEGMPFIPLQLTGTQIDAKPIDICTMALQDGQLTSRDMAGTFVNRGVLHFLAGDYRSSLSDFDSSIRIDSNIGEAHANRGAALVALQRWADSIPSITKGIEMQAAEMEKSYYNRAIANEEMGNVRGAYMDYMKAAELKPEWEPPKAQLMRFTVKRRE